MLYKVLIRPILFSFDPEKIHYFSFNFIKSILSVGVIRKLTSSFFNVESPLLEKKLFGLKFKNPIGLAAGFDKDAKLFKELSTFGFSFIEIGTVTPKPQEGNPKPRLFRLKEDQALINRMGFNNEGLSAAVKRLKSRSGQIIIGGNIGKNKVTPNDKAVDDYLLCFDALYEHVDYFVVNVSSPNTPDLRSLQEKEPLQKLLGQLQDRNATKDCRKPILLKIAPDLNQAQLDDIIEIVTLTKIDGLIASNTTIQRDGLKISEKALSQIGNGGLSGKPVRNRSTEIIKYISEKTNQKLPIIAVGGIFTAKDAIEKLEAGASLLQVYTGFIYEGPSMVKEINKELIKYYGKN